MAAHNLKHPPCEQHLHGRPVSICPVCGKTVCSECIKQYGYFCSEACRDIAHAAEPEPEIERTHYVEAQQRYDTIARILFKRIPLTLLVLVVAVVLIRWIDPTGDEQWHITLPESGGIHDMVEIENTLVILDGNGGVTALDTRNGQQQWTLPEEGGAFSMAHINQSVILAGRSGIRCLSVHDGSLQWDLALQDGAYQVHWKATANGLITGSATYSSSSVDGEGANHTVHSEVALVDTATGDVRWRRTIESQTVHQVGFFAGQPWCLTSEADTFQLQALNPATGRRAWGLRAPGEEPPSLLITDDHLVLALSDELMGLGADGTTVWSEPIGGSLSLATQTMGQIVVCLDGRTLRSLDGRSGKTRWSADVPGWVEQLSVADETLYVAVAGWANGRDDPTSGPRETLPDSPEKELLEELFFNDEDITDEGGQPPFVEIDRLAAYDLRRGRLLWDVPAQSISIIPGTACCYLLKYVTGLGTLMGGDTSGLLIVRAAGTGEVLWRYRTDADLTSLVEGNQHVYLETTTILPEMLSKFSRGRPPQIGLTAVRKHGFLHRLTHW